MVGKYLQRKSPGGKWAWRLAFLAALVLALGGTALAQESLRIAAIVNDEAISVYDLNNRVRMAIFTLRLSNDARTRMRLEAQVLRNLIDEKLRLQEAKKLNITVAKKEIDQAIGRLETQNQIPRGKMWQILRENKIDKSTLKGQVEADIAWNKVVRRSVRVQVKIGDDAIDEALADMEANKGKPEYLIGEIFLPFSLAATVGNVEEFAAKLVRQIRNGADFAAVARTFSGSASAMIGGRLGWMRSDQIDDDLAKVLGGMGINQLSRPIEAVDGFYIVQLHGRRLATSLATAEIILNLYQIFLPLSEGASEETIKESMARVREATKKARVCGDMEKAGSQLGGAQSGQLSDIKMSGLPPNLGNAVRGLAIGQVSPPVRMPQGLVVVMICSRRGGGPDLDVRKRLKRMLRARKAELIARRILRDLRRSAFIDIRK